MRRTLCSCDPSETCQGNQKNKKIKEKWDKKYNVSLFFVNSQCNHQNQTTMNTRNKQLTAKERLFTGKHHGRHIDDDFEHDCLDGDSGEMGTYDTFDDSNVKKND
jgi:hypothetical protein